MLAIVHCGFSHERRTLALEVLKYLRTLYSRQVSHLQKELSSTESWATARYFANQSRLHRLQIEKLRELVAGLIAYKLPLCSFLESNAAHFVSEDKPWQWHVGDEVPKWPRKDSLASKGHREPLSIPRVCDS